jgi:hypothetical protein
MAKLKIEHLKFRIGINELCYIGVWQRTVDGNKIRLEHHEDGIHLLVNGIEHAVRWKVSEQEQTMQLRNGGYPRPYVYYVYGRDGRRYRYLYLHGSCIGTRNDHGAGYQVNYLSHKQRKRWLAARRIRLGTRKLRRLEARERRRNALRATR